MEFLGNEFDLPPQDSIDHFKNTCPVCGKKLKMKLVKKGKPPYTANKRSLICNDCNYAEYVEYNPHNPDITIDNIDSTNI
jgi:C4-type Zn-finger protein